MIKTKYKQQPNIFNFQIDVSLNELPAVENNGYALPALSGIARRFYIKEGNKVPRGVANKLPITTDFLNRKPAGFLINDQVFIRIIDALQLHPCLEHGNIRITVDDEMVTIEGLVIWENERIAVEQTIGHCVKDRKIINKVMVKAEEGLSLQSDFWHSLFA